MSRTAYVKKRFRKATLAIINDADIVLTEYKAIGYDLTLRQLYYKFIARDLFPDTWIDDKYNKEHGLAPGTKNTDKNYKRFGKTITEGRLAGLLDWKQLVDRTRSLSSLQQHSTPEDAVKDLSRYYHIDMWENQPCYVEAWVEKDAMVDILRQACNPWDVPYGSTRGYTSSSACHETALRLEQESYSHEGGVHIIHLSDHDPSGIDMARDLQDRFELFRVPDVHFHRIALTMDQIEEKDPVPNPAKLTDPRAEKYIDRFGDKSWELDALEPSDIDRLVKEAVMEIVDVDCWNESREEEKRGRSVVLQLAREWKERAGDIHPDDAILDVDAYCEFLTADVSDDDDDDPWIEG